MIYEKESYPYLVAISATMIPETCSLYINYYAMSCNLTLTFFDAGYGYTCSQNHRYKNKTDVKKSFDLNGCRH